MTQTTLDFFLSAGSRMEPERLSNREALLERISSGCHELDGPKAVGVSASLAQLDSPTVGSDITNRRTPRTCTSLRTTPPRPARSGGEGWGRRHGSQPFVRRQSAGGGGGPSCLRDRPPPRQSARRRPVLARTGYVHPSPGRARPFTTHALVHGVRRPGGGR